MTAYCSQQDVEDLFRAKALIELTSDTGTSLDTTMLGRVRESAARWMDSFLAARYTVPITNAGDVIILAPHNATVTAYRLWAKTSIPARENPFESDYIATREWLKGFGPGGQSALPSDSLGTSNTDTWGSEEPVFSGEDLVP